LPRITIDLPETLYKSLEKYALIKGTSLESVILDLLRRDLGFIGEVDSYYSYKHGQIDRAVEEAMKAISKRLVRIRIRDRDKLIEKYINPLGRFLAIIKELYGKIPEKLVVKEVIGDPRLKEILRKHIGAKIDDPGKTLINYIEKKIKPIAPAFKIRIEGDGVESIIVFENPANLESYAGIGSRIMRRRIRR
jgi:hypothetical protein